MALSLSQEPFTISTGALHVTFNNDGNIILRGKSDIQKQGDTKTFYDWIVYLYQTLQELDKDINDKDDK
jgi:hypothetical protein